MIFTRRWKRLVGLGIVLALMITPHAFASDPVKIGAMFIASGPMGGYGKHARQAIDMAVEEINAAGGILGRPLEAMVEDTQLKKDVVLDLAKRFIEQDKVDFLMGPTSSGLAMALTEVARDNQKILVLTQAAADALTGAKFHLRFWF